MMALYPHCTATSKAGGEGTSRTNKPSVCTKHRWPTLREPEKGHRVGHWQQRVEAKSVGGHPKRMVALQWGHRVFHGVPHTMAVTLPGLVGCPQPERCHVVLHLLSVELQRVVVLPPRNLGGRTDSQGYTSAQAVQEGFLLQNIHLVARWLGTLEKMVEQYSLGSHTDYRVFMSAEPAPSPEAHIIPQGLLENAIKITSEPPTGMYANLHKALDLFTQVPSPHRGCAVHSLSIGFGSACPAHPIPGVSQAEHLRGRHCRHGRCTRSQPTPRHIHPPGGAQSPHLSGCDLGVTRVARGFLNQGGCYITGAFPKAEC